MATISFAKSQVNANEQDVAALVEIAREGDLADTVVVQYSVFDNTAVAGADYRATTGTVTFRPGDTSETVSVPLLNDALSEGSESFSVQILDVTGGTLGFPRTASVVVEDDETPSGPTLPDPSALSVKPALPVVTGLKAPTAFTWVPGQPGTMVISEKSGLIKVARDGTVSGPPLLDLRARVNDLGDRGLVDVELHPDFANQPYLYVYYGVDPPETAGNTGKAGPEGEGNRFVHLVRYTVDTVGGALQVRPGSDVVLLGGAGRSLSDISGGGRINSEDDLTQPPSGIRPDGTNIDNYIAVDGKAHAGGDMEFGPDGALYVSVGDGTYFNFADPRAVRVQDVGNLSGKVLRIDPVTGKGLADNPFFVPGLPDANQSKVYQLGLRNGFRMAFDGDGQLFVGDVGWYSYEEINTGGPGANFGWPYYEGARDGVSARAPYHQTLPQAQAFYAANQPATVPLAAFSHLDYDPGFNIQALILGEFYTGSLYPGVLRGDLFFADLAGGRIFSIDPADPTRTVNLLTTQDASIVAMEQGPDGALYYADIVGGTISRLMIDSAPKPLATIATVGAGPGALVLRLQQDAFQGDALYTVSIDGVQVGGVQRATATRASGQFDVLTVRGDLVPGAHRAEVRFLNDAWEGSDAQDRNLYVASASYDGVAIAASARALTTNGPATIDFTRPVGALTTVGAGPDALVLRIQQDAYQGNAQYTISVDGAQVGGVLSASATRLSGQADTVTVRGDFGPGAHGAEVRFLNDLFTGAPATDRNLFVTGATYNGDTVPFSSRELLSPGPAFIGFTEPAARGSVTVGAGPDTLLLSVQQDRYQGDAHYTVRIDGVQVGGVIAAVATRASGQLDTLTVRGSFAPGAHRAEIRFENDLYGGGADRDRNLFTAGGSYNGVAVPFSTRELMRVGSASIAFDDVGARA